MKLKMEGARFHDKDIIVLEREDSWGGRVATDIVIHNNQVSNA